MAIKILFPEHFEYFATPPPFARIELGYHWWSKSKPKAVDRKICIVLTIGAWKCNAHFTEGIYTSNSRIIEGAQAVDPVDCEKNTWNMRFTIFFKALYLILSFSQGGILDFSLTMQNIFRKF